MKIPCVLEAEQRSDMIGARRIEDDDPFALFELADEQVWLHQRHGDSGGG